MTESKHSERIDSSATVGRCAEGDGRGRAGARWQSQRFHTPGHPGPPGVERSDAERAGASGGEAMTSPVSRPWARLTMDCENGGLLAMRCTWQPVGWDGLACDMERNSRRLANSAIMRLLGRSSLKSSASSHVVESQTYELGRSVGRQGARLLAVHVVSLLSLGRQSLRQALPSWRGFQAVNVLSSSLRSLELSPGRTPYTVSAPK